MFKIKWLLERWLENWLYHAAHRLTELSSRLSQKPPDMEALIHELQYNWLQVIASASSRNQEVEKQKSGIFKRFAKLVI